MNILKHVDLGTLSGSLFQIPAIKFGFEHAHPLGPAWAQLGPSLGPAWAQLGPGLGPQVGPAWAPRVGLGWGPPTQAVNLENSARLGAPRIPPEG